MSPASLVVKKFQRIETYQTDNLHLCPKVLIPIKVGINFLGHLCDMLFSDIGGTWQGAGRPELKKSLTPLLRNLKGGGGRPQ